MMKQQDALDKILKSLIKSSEEEYHTNEATLKNNFFYHLRLNNPKYQITVEESLKSHIQFNGRADYYLNDISTNSYQNDIIIEFKINCINKGLIKHDIDKLEKIKTLNPKIVCIFINVFTKKLDFINYLPVIDMFSQTKIYTVTISKSVDNFYIKKDLEIIRYPLNETTLITSTDRLIFSKIIPENTPTIKIPNFEGQTKYINIYPKARSNASFGKAWNKNKNDEKPYHRFINPKNIK